MVSRIGPNFLEDALGSEGITNDLSQYLAALTNYANLDVTETCPFIVEL